MSGLDPHLHRLAPDEHTRVYQDVIRPRLFGTTIPTGSLTATILGGTPGTGKSSVARELLAEEPAAKISSDRVSKFHPEWLNLLRTDDSTAGFYVRADAVDWVNTAIDEAAERRLPVLIDTALADPGRTALLSETFREHGYSVNFAIVAGPAAFSQIGVLNRHYTDRQTQGGARIVDQPDRLFDGVAASTRAIETEALGQTVTVYRRTAEVLFHNELGDDGRWVNPPRAEETLHAERARPWTRDESEWFIQTAQKLAAVRPEELGHGMRPGWQPAVREAVLSAEPHLHSDFRATAAQLLDAGVPQNLNEARRLRSATFPASAGNPGPAHTAPPRPGGPGARAPGSESTPEYD